MPLIAERALNRPLLLTPHKAETILGVLAGRLGVNGPKASEFEGEQEFVRDDDGRVVVEYNEYGYAGPKSKPYKIAEGVAIISIVGTLVNRGAWIGASSGLVSYEGIQFQLKSAAADGAVKAILLDIESPGGEAIGAFETAALVRKINAQKPVTAVVNGMAASAAYAIASGAGRIVTTDTGLSGSIGVVILHADFSRALDMDGITPTLIFAGAHKVDGNPYEKLPANVRVDLQKEVDTFYGLFLQTVAAGRGSRLTEDQARATEARSFLGAEAVELGLADAVGTFEAVLADLASSNRKAPAPLRTGRSMKGQKMEHETETVAPDAAAIEAARAEGADQGRQEERARFAAVLSADGIAGNAQRMDAAVDLAAKAPAMSADDIIAHVGKHGASAEAAKSESKPGLSLAERNQVPDSLGAAAGAGAGSAKPKSRLSKMIDGEVQRAGR